MCLSSIYSSGMRTADVINLASVSKEKHRAIYKRTWVNKPKSLPLIFDPMEQAPKNYSWSLDLLSLLLTSVVKF